MAWEQVLIFTRTKHGANRLAEYLVKNGLPAAAIQGNKSQSARTKALADFKANTLRILVATDIAARGLDIDQLPHVINFELPNVSEDYVHRIGRTGRAGAKGTSISLAGEDDAFQVPPIEELLGNKLECVPPEEHLLKPVPKREQSAEEKAATDANEAEQAEAAAAAARAARERLEEIRRLRRLSRGSEEP